MNATRRLRMLWVPLIALFAMACPALAQAQTQNNPTSS